MSKRRGHLKIRKGRLRISRVLFVGFLLLSILGIVGNSSLISHIKEFRMAIDRYDVRVLTEEISWIEKNASWLKKIPLIRDGEFWLKLNQGQFEDLESQLAQFSDDKHRFWSFQLHLALSQEGKAQEDIEGFKSSAYRDLAQGLINVKRGNYEKGNEQVRSATDSELSRDEQVLKNISIARIEMSLQDLEKAQKAWERAEALSPLNPLVIEAEYDLALASGQWGRAQEIFPKLEALPGYEERPDFLIKKALLALTMGERQLWEQTMEKLSSLKNGEAYRDYLLGIEYYEQGEFKQAAEYFQSSMKGSLPTIIHQDAEKAWAQSKERVEADSLLSKAKKSS